MEVTKIRVGPVSHATLAATGSFAAEDELPDQVCSLDVVLVDREVANDSGRRPALLSRLSGP
jgi:hypothetical protein